MKYLFLALVLVSSISHAKLNVITTTSNLADLVKQIGGNQVEVESLCRGVQDPHFLEAKPSYTFKLSKTDLLVSVGAGLEIGWLPLVIRGSRNPKLREGEERHLIASELVNLLDQSKVSVSRSMGDIHPEGNPHFLLGPNSSVIVAKGIANKLIELDSKNAKHYKSRLDIYVQEIAKRMVTWKQKVRKDLKVVSYHKTLSYFYKDFGIENVDVLEPKPGIPPSASHILSLIAKMKEKNVKKIIIENYFDTSVAKRIQKEIPEVVIEVVPVGVGGKEGVDNIFKLYDYLVTKIGL